MSVHTETIGDATLYLGDCLKIMPTLGKISHIISDPPYESNTHKNIGGIRRNDGGRVTEKLDFESIDCIREAVISACAPICVGWTILFCTTEGVARWAHVINLSKLKYKRACAWIKPDAMPQMNGQGPANGMECFVAAWGGAGHARWNSGGKRGVYTHCVNGPSRHGEHPTEKPISLMAEIITDFTQSGDTILDPFMGSGTTGVACIQYGRKFIGIEQNERWFDIACKRIDAAVKQPRLFSEPIPKTKQSSLFDGEAA